MQVGTTAIAVAPPAPPPVALPPALPPSHGPIFAIGAICSVSWLVALTATLLQALRHAAQRRSERHEAGVEAEAGAPAST